MKIYVLEVEGLNTGFAYYNQFRADVWAANDPANRSYSTVVVADAEEEETLLDVGDEEEGDCPLCS